MYCLLLEFLEESERNLAEHLYEEYQMRMYTIAYHILHNEADAEDAVENATVRIIHNISEFTDASRSKIEALIVLYSKCASIDIVRKRVKAPLLTVDDETIPEPIDMQADVENTVLLNEYMETLKNQIEKLPPKYKEVLLLKYFYDKRDREIAELLHIKENAVRTRLTRARMILQQKINEGKNEEH